jgi:hypothetical protein
MEAAMKPYNYVQEAWERRFQIGRKRSAADSFASGFVLGAAMTGALFLYGAANAILI